MYVELGPEDGDGAKLKFTFGAATFSRSYEVKVSQFLCDSDQRPPEGCLQYYTGTEGRITSFNWAGNNGHLKNQKYTMCLRQEAGFCCVNYQVCNGEQFAIDTKIAKTAGIEDQCSGDYIIIEGRL